MTLSTAWLSAMELPMLISTGWFKTQLRRYTEGYSHTSTTGQSLTCTFLCSSPFSSFSPLSLFFLVSPRRLQIVSILVSPFVSQATSSSITLFPYLLHGPPLRSYCNAVAVFIQLFLRAGHVHKSL